MTLRIYIAGPMTGLPSHNYPAFHAAEDALTAKGYKPLNPAINDLTRTREWQFYIRQALSILLNADAVALLPGWETSRGANLEHTVATALGLPIRTIDDWLNPERL